MKINLRSVLVILILTSASHGIAQQSINVVAGDFYISAPSSQSNIEADLSIENSSNADMSILVNRDNSHLLNGHQSYYCWNQCYDTTVSLSPDPLVVPARTTNDVNFHGYIYPFGISGISQVTYTFFDQNNPSDTALATITYDVSTSTGVDELASRTSLSNASPNPANNMAAIIYNLPDVNNAHILLYNMIGNMVRDYKLSSTQMLKLISVADLPSGVYIYSLVNGGKSLMTKKLIVAHR